MRTVEEARDYIYDQVTNKATGEIDSAIGQLKDNTILSRDVTRLLLTKHWIWQEYRKELEECQYEVKVINNQGMLDLAKAAAENDRKPLQGWEGKEIKIVWIKPEENKQVLTTEQKKAIKEILESAREAAKDA